MQRSQIKSSENTNTIFLYELIIDSYKRIIEVENTNIKLTKTEFNILYLLADNPGIVFTKDQLYSLVRKDQYIGGGTMIIHSRKRCNVR